MARALFFSRRRVLPRYHVFQLDISKWTRPYTPAELVHKVKSLLPRDNGFCYKLPGKSGSTGILHVYTTCSKYVVIHLTLTGKCMKEAGSGRGEVHIRRGHCTYFGQFMREKGAGRKNKQTRVVYMITPLVGRTKRASKTNDM